MIFENESVWLGALGIWDVWVHCFLKTNSIGIRNSSKTNKILFKFFFNFISGSQTIQISFLTLFCIGIRTVNYC
jgi:hypothetical protein